MNVIKADNYSVFFEQDKYSSLKEYFEKTTYSSLFILVDENTKELCLPVFLSKFLDISEYHLITIQSGETHKNLETCSSVWKQLTDYNADRQSIIINIGGGMLTDLGGFVAATFKRGIRFINISTTLLGMVDASVGGKTGVDLDNLKNQIGLFALPEMVLIDINYLPSLPKKELISGMAEIVKYGLTYDGILWETIKYSSNFSYLELSDWIFRSVNIKNEIVLQDPKERHLRKILNYGHTIGHAIETYFLENDNKETLTHGEAVAIGLVAETYISSKLFKFPKKELETLKKYIINFFGKIDFNTTDYDRIIALMKHDKKNIDGQINFVLLNKIADYKLDCTVDNDLIIEALNYYQLK
jgi:3-dehydroquinate synthase